MRGARDAALGGRDAALGARDATAGQLADSEGAPTSLARWPGPPAVDECAPFYRPYVEETMVAAADSSLGRLLAADVSAWQGLLARVSPLRESYRYASGKWTIREVVGHVIDAERVFAVRALAFARNDPASYPGFDENKYVRESGADERRLPELRTELVAVRAATVALFEGFDTSVWDRRGTASGREFTVRSLAWIAAGHSLHHRTVLASRYRAALQLAADPADPADPADGATP